MATKKKEKKEKKTKKPLPKKAALVLNDIDTAAKAVVSKWLNDASFWEDNDEDGDQEGEPGEGHFQIVSCKPGAYYERVVTVRFTVSDLSIDEQLKKMKESTEVKSDG